MSRSVLPWRWILPAAIIVVGAAAAGLLLRGDPAPQARAAGDAGRVVRYVVAERRNVRAELRGYGNVKPARTWTAVAQVVGKVTYKHTELEPGQPVLAGTVLLRIDRHEYELTLKQYEATHAQAEQAVAQLQQEQRNLERNRAIIEEQLQIAEAELQRAREAFDRQAANRNDVDAREQQVLSHRAELATTQNALDLLPARSAEQQAVLEAAVAAIDKAKLDIDRCTVTAPFTGRVRTVDVEEGQNIRLGDEMVELFGVDQAELHCQVSLDDLKYWLPEELLSPLETGMLGQPWTTAGGPIQGEVVLATTDRDIRWAGELDRFLGELDPFTRMLTVVIRVDNPYANLGRADRPPLVEGMFCEGVLRGRLHEQVFPIPNRAMHDGHVYLINAVGELEIRPVGVRFTQGNVAIVDEGLVDGDRVVTTDLFPAIAGMKLRGERDDSPVIAEVQP
ncbi:MAG: hypothetical protein KAS72_01190 [Phycisphaerales bacterium]|nr:hypothetical protein [Phycisphaerales bacterium]